MDTLLDTLRTELNCNSVVLLPVTNETSTHGSKKVATSPKVDTNAPKVALIPLLPLARAVATDVAGGGATEHKAEAKVEDESLEKGTPAGLCISSRKPVRVDNALTDRRFKYKRASGLSGLSQLCVPVFGSEAADTTGAEIVAVIKCFNKMSFSGLSVGMPFSDNDVALAVAQARLIAAEGLRNKRQTTLSALGFKTDQTAAEKIQAQFRGVQSRKKLVRTGVVARTMGAVSMTAAVKEAAGRGRELDQRGNEIVPDDGGVEIVANARVAKAPGTNKKAVGVMFVEV